LGFLLWDYTLIKSIQWPVGGVNQNESTEEHNSESLWEPKMVWSYDEDGQKNNPEVVAQISIKCRSGEVLVESWVEFVVAHVSHEPDNGEDEDPCTCGIKALDCVVFEKWIVEKLAQSTVVHWTTNCIKENQAANKNW